MKFGINFVSILKFIIISLIVFIIIQMQSITNFVEEIGNPKISIIMPVYNTGKYLKQSLKSLIQQTLKDIEIICINDGSFDNSLRILQKYERKDSRIKVINQENKGAGSARNVGLKIAKGDYIVFVDADDYTEPNYLKIMYNQIMIDNADACICCAARENVKQNRIFKEEKLLNFSLIPNKVFSYRDLPENFFQFTNTVPWNKMFKKNLLIKNDLYFQELERFNDFYFIYASLVASSRITTVKKVLYTQRICHDINLHSSLYKSPYCFLEAATQLYEWLINRGIYDILQKSFIKAFIKIAEYNAERCRKYNDIYINVINLIKEEFKKYKVEENIENFEPELKNIAKKFLFSDPEKE